MVTSQIEKELIADIYINRNKTITKALFSSTIFHGYKDLLIGQPALSSIEITSRVYGFCGGAHQQAATMALEHLAEAIVPPNAHILRSIIHAAEIVQNSIKWFYTSFAPDLADSSFQNHPLHQTAVDRFIAFKGSSFRQGLIGATYPISFYSSIAGQWPHAEFIIPGGVSTVLKSKEITKSKSIIQDFKQKWLEPILLKGSLESYLQVTSWKELLAWFYEKKAHQNGDLGLFFRTCMEYGLDEIGGGKHPCLSFGTFWDKNSKLAMTPTHYQKSSKFPSGIFNKMKYRNVKPYDFITSLSATFSQPEKEVLGSMPSYEVGSLARMLLLGKRNKKEHTQSHHELIKDIFSEKGSSVFIRAFARLHEIMVLTDFIEKSLDELNHKGEFSQPAILKDGIGFGMTEAPRGSLAHLVELEKGKIKNYQILAPTIANINVGATEKKCAPLGQALIGLTIKDIENPVEIGLIARSFDACLRCTINFKKSSSKKEIRQVTI